MAEALLSPILEQLTTIVALQVQEEVILVVGVQKQVDELKSNLLAIQSVLEDADRKQVKDKAVRAWVDKLKDVCYDMDDVLDKWSTAILTWKMEEAEENTPSLQKMRCSFLGSPCFCLNQVVRRCDVALKMKKVGEKVDEIAKQSAKYGFEPYRATDELQRLTSTSFVNESSVIGRDGAKRNVVSKLLAESSQEAQDVDVISVVGLGGIGKTTLAQLAFNDAEVTAHFEKKIWAFIPKGIERITCLRTLDVFIVCGGGENESKAANIRELKNLNHIGGSLEIRNLGGGKEDASDAAEAQLKNKKRLLRLELYFDHNRENGILIEALQPPLDLEVLTIWGYGGLEFPNWMTTLTRLQGLTLCDCENLEVLPPLRRLPYLESLELRGLKVRRLDAGFLGIEKDENGSINEGEIARVTAFPKLKKLSIYNFKEVEEWDGIERRVGEEDANTTSIISIMPQLRLLIIGDCPLLRALPDYVLAAPLQELHIGHCPNLRKRYGKEEMGEDWQKISHIPKIDFHRNWI